MKILRFDSMKPVWTDMSILVVNPNSNEHVTGEIAAAVACLRIEGGVRAVYMTNNPDKLSHWSVAEID